MVSVIRGSDNFDSGSLPEPTYVKLSSGSFAGSSAVEVTLSGAYDVYEILLSGVRDAATNVVYYARFKSGSTTYTSVYHTNNTNNQGYIFLGSTDGNADNLGLCGTYTIFKPHDTSVYTHSTMIGGQADNYTWQQTSNADRGGYLRNTADITSVLFDTTSTNNFSHGTWTLYGVTT